MKNIMKTLFALVFALACAQIAVAQTNVTPTTLTNAIDQRDTTFVVGSTSGMTASTSSTSTYILIDKELMKLTAIPVSGTVTVSRTNQGGSNPVRHSAGVYVVYGKVGTWNAAQTGSATSGVFLSGIGNQPSGGCTLTSQEYSPVFNPSQGKVFACHGARWAEGPWPSPGNNPTISAVRNICTYKLANPGAIVADLTTYGTDAVRVAGTLFRASMEVTYPQVVTGLSSLTGTTSPTVDKQLFALYDGAGFLLASSAIAGHAAATADIFYDQPVALVNGAAATSLIILPGRYYFGFQDDTATTTIQMIPGAGGWTGGVNDSSTGTFGTLPNFTPPTTFSTSKGPIGCLY